VATTVALAHRAHPPYLDLVGLRNDETRSILNHKIIHDVASMSRRWVLRARNWVLSKWGFRFYACFRGQHVGTLAPGRPTVARALTIGHAQAKASESRERLPPWVSEDGRARGGPKRT